MSFKVGDKVVIISNFWDYGNSWSIRKMGNVLTIKKINHHDLNSREWQVSFEEGLGADFEHIRLATPLDEVLE